MNRKLIITIATLIVILGGAAIGIFLTKGYTFSPQEGKVVGTGIVSLTSTPDGASVYLDGHLTTATNANIASLPPKKYQVKILKEGFIPWEKEIEVKAGLVAEIKATLFPSLPTIYPLTFNGVAHPTLSPDGSKLVFAVPSSTEGAHIRQKGGVWVWTMGSAPIAFSRSAEPHQIIDSTSSLDFTKATLKFSPDSKQVLVNIQENNLPGESNLRNFLLSADQFTGATDARDITPTLTSTLKAWEEDNKTKDEARLLTIKNLAIKNIASASADIKWSPDETKFIVSSESGVKTYDLSSGKNYDLPEALVYSWLPDSRHIILVQDGKVSISEFDGANAGVIYAGKFEDSAIFPWPDSSRLVVMTSFDTPTASKPNLFGVNLK